VAAPSRPRAEQAGTEYLISASLGRAIREARSAKKLSMRALAGEADISQPFLSQIEGGQTMPSLVTLYRIAKVLGLSPSELLPAEPEPDDVHLSRRADAKWRPIAEVENSATTRIVSKGAASVQEYIVEPGQYMGDWYESDGELTVFVIDGRITVEVESRGEWELGPGDALHHPGALRNRWSVVGADPVRIVLVYAGQR
jgi:transcriptional regulator with XRE-family HTH domain